MTRLLLIWILIMTSPASAKECVVLLHGLARSSNSMLLMEWRLKREGFDTINLDYPSKDATIEALSGTALPKALSGCTRAASVHFVTHSMGGILLRHFLSQPKQKPRHLGRTVMLGPPNQGTPVIDQMTDLPGFDLWASPAGKQLGTGADSLPLSLPPVDYPVGIIAGSQSISPILSTMIDGPNDGKVPVAATAVKGMADHITLPVTHTFMMNNPRVQDQVVTFLKTGKFEHD